MTAAGHAEVVGRSRPLGRLDAVMSASASGRRSAALVSGEAGIGKTSLIRAALEVSGAGAVVGWGTCWQGGGAPGFWPWMQAFGHLVRAMGTGPAREAAGEGGGTLSVLVRDLAPPGPTVATTAVADGHRLLLLDAAVRWLEALTADRHVVIVLDDLQWADPSTFDLLDHVIAAPVGARLLVIGAYRHDELGPDARERLARIGSHAEHLHLEGLTVEGVGELVAAIGDPAAASRRAAELHRRTGGHPLFVSELARLSDDDRREGHLPTVVTGAVARRLDALPGPTRGMLEVASVLGNRLLPDILATVADEPATAVVQRLATAVEAGVVRATSDDGYWFAHDLFREVLYGGLDATRRAALHGSVGDALAARRERGGQVLPSDLARHFAKATTSRDGGETIRWAREAAADERRRSAFTEAAGHLRRARDAVIDAGGSLEAGLLVGLLVEEADDRARAGHPGTARSLLAAAAEAAPDATHRADVALAVQGLGAKFAARRDAVIEQLETALRGLAGIDVAREARLTAALARELQHSVSGDRARVGPLSEQAIALGRRSGDDETLMACLLARHDALWGPGTGAQRAELGHEIAALATGLRDTDRVAEGLLLEANGLLESGSPGFRPILERWFGLLDARDEPRDRYMVATRRAALALLEGDTDRAEALMDEAARIGERIHEPDTGNVLMSQRVALARARDDPDELRTLAADAVAWWTGAPVLAHGVAAGAYAAAGDLDAAGRAVAMVAASGGWDSENSYLRSVLVSHLAEAATALGDTELCRDLFTEVDPLTDSCGVNGAVVAFAGPFAHTAGILAGQLGDHATAEVMLRRSVATARGLGADVWVRHGELALVSLTERRAAGVTELPAEDPASRVASLTRDGSVWTVSLGQELMHLPHLKGLADIATLVERPGREVSALELAGGTAAAAGSSDTLIDLDALQAYRLRLDELAVEIDRAGDDADLGRCELLEDEREKILSEVRRATGLGGRLRTDAKDPAERARKAVTARVRDAIGRLATGAPTLAAHLDRSIRTGLRCSYVPIGDDAPIRWNLRSETPPKR